MTEDGEIVAGHAGGWHWTALTVGVGALVIATVIFATRDGRPYLRGDSRYYYVAALSMLFDHDVDLGNQLRGGLAVHGDEVALDVRGRWVPKHPLLLPILAGPFIRVLGPSGGLVFNLLQLGLLIALLHRLAMRLAPPMVAALATMLLVALSQLAHYGWNFSPDVLTTLLFVGALLAVDDRRDLLGGMLLGAAAIGKLTFLLLAPVALLLIVRDERRARRVVAFGIGLGLLLAASALLDLHLFGSPWTTSYDRILRLENGQPRLHSTREDFDQPLVVGLRAQLLDARHGLWSTDKLVVLSLLLLPLVPRASRRWAWLVALVTLELLLFYGRYRLWRASDYGNRFLMPVVVLAVVPLAAAIARLVAARAPTPALADP